MTAGALVAGFSRAAGKGKGSVVGGHAILAIDPGALSHLSTGRTLVLVSGTNGKTTTTRLLSEGLAGAWAGQGPGAAPRTFTNAHGANMPTGLVTTLAESREGDIAVLEVDEAWLPKVVAQAHPRALVLLNLSRDQLDRHHEVRHLAKEWAAMCRRLPGDAMVVANADDPLVTWAAREASLVTWVSAGAGWRLDSVSCPQCGGVLIFADGVAPATLSSHPQGAQAGRRAPWHCPNCGLSRPVPDLALGPRGEASWSNGDEVPLELGLPGHANRANALMALAAAWRLGAAPAKAAQAMSQVSEVAGRYSLVELGGSAAKLFLAKNPAGWLEAFEMLAPAPAPVVVAINARAVDGRDTSWIWDVPFERLARRPVVASGERAFDLSVRLHYAEVPHQVHPSLAEAARSLGSRRCQVVANYSAFQDLLAACPPARPADDEPQPGVGKTVVV